MYLKHILTASLLALCGSVTAQGQYGAVPNQSMTPDSSQSSSMVSASSTPSTSTTPTSSMASTSATPTGSYSSTPSTLSSSMKPTSSSASSDGILGGLLGNKKLNLRAEPGPMDEFTRMMPSGDYSQPASQPAAYPTNRM